MTGTQYSYSYQHAFGLASVADYDWTSLIVGTLLVAGLVQQLIAWLDFPILSVFELIWNAFVYVMPSSLILGLRSIAGPKPTTSTTTQRGTSTTHAEKSQALREVLRLGSGSGPSLIRKATSPYPTAPKGLGNWDNSCYQNSVLQALAALPSMHHFYAQIDSTLGGTADESTLAALRALGAQLNNVAGDKAYYWTPSALKSMSSWTQQDAQEYFSKLVDAMEKDVSGELRRLIFESEAAQLSLADAQDASDSPPSAHQKRRDGFAHRAGGSALARAVQTPFEGLLAQRVGCTECGYTEGLSLIPFNCLMVPLGREPDYALAECLNEFTQLEDIEGVECARCSLLQAKARLEALSARVVADTAGSSESESTPEEKAAVERQHSLYSDRLAAISTALQEDDFSESTLIEKCHLTKQHRKSSRKSRQAAVMRAPRCLVVHINRSMFDEQTFALLKNHAHVTFPLELDIAPWCIASPSADETANVWEMDPSKPLVYGANMHLHLAQQTGGKSYTLKAVITHYGRHENGHYICYRQSPERVMEEVDSPLADSAPDAKGDLQREGHRWWRLSDETVTPVTEEDIAAQGGAFMLFYELDTQSSGANAVDEDQYADEDVSTSEDESPSLDSDITSQSADSVESQTTLDADERAFSK